MLLALKLHPHHEGGTFGREESKIYINKDKHKPGNAQIVVVLLYGEKGKVKVTK